jgi:hypothetical protein
MTTLFTRHAANEDIARLLNRLGKLCVAHGVSILWKSLSPDSVATAASPLPGLVHTLSRLTIPPGFALMFGDDNPLWGGSLDRTTADFRAALATALAQWDRLARRCDLGLMMLTPETMASDPASAQYQADVAAVLRDFRLGTLTP